VVNSRCNVQPLDRASWASSLQTAIRLSGSGVPAPSRTYAMTFCAVPGAGAFAGSGPLVSMNAWAAVDVYGAVVVGVGV